MNEKLIKKIRSEISQKSLMQVAKETGLSYGTVWNINKSGKIKKTQTVEMLMKHYGVSK